LPERHRCEFGVCADRSQHDRFLDVIAPTGIDQLDAHHRVLVKKEPGVLAIRTDASHGGSAVNDNLRPRLREKALDCIVTSQIEIPAPGDNDLIAAQFPKVLYDVGAEKTGATCYKDAL